MPKVEEYKDANQKHRIRQKADNGEISDSTHQGYFNLGDARQGKIKTSIFYIQHYWNEMSEEDKQELKNFVNAR